MRRDWDEEVNGTMPVPRPRRPQVPHQPESPAPSAPTLAAVDVESLATVAEVEKKLKAVAKKLRAVDALAADRAAGKELNAEQVVKLDSAPALRDQVAALEARMATLST